MRKFKASDVQQTTKQDNLGAVWQLIGAVALARFAFPFLLSALIFFVIVTPPLQVPDEMQHFARSYQLSELAIKPAVRGKQAGAMLPSSLNAFTEFFLGTRVLHGDRAVRPITPSRVMQFEDRLESASRDEVLFTNMSIYSPAAYLPQATAIFLGRHAGLGTLSLFYLSRLANALTCFMIMVIAFRTNRGSRNIVLFCSFLPMTVFECASVSADGLVICSAFLLCAALFKLADTHHWSSADAVAAAIAGVVLCSTKIVYLPLLFVGIPCLFSRHSTAWDKSSYLAAFLSAATISVFWYLVVKNIASQLTLFPGGDATAQFAFVLSQPLSFIVSARHTLFWYPGFLIESLFGTFGWLTIKLPPMFYISIAAACFLSASEDVRINRSEAKLNAILNMLLVTVCVTLVLLALYICCTPPGLNEVVGVQGRYFIPLLPVAMNSLANLLEGSVFRFGRRVTLLWLPLSMLNLLSGGLVLWRAFWA